MNERSNASPRSNHGKTQDSQALATILQRRREQLEISLTEAEQATRIRAKYIEAIETGDYDTLKDDVYARGYVKNYADYLGLDPKPILKMYDAERAGQREMKRQSIKQNRRPIQLGLKPIRNMKWVVTPRTFVALSTLAVVSAVVLYIIWQVLVLSAPPKLVINNTEARLVTASFGYVSGRVENGSDLFINDSPVLVAADGSFRERIALTNGLNEIKLTAKNRLGKVATQSYIITARLAVDTTPEPITTDANTAAPTTPTTYDGVQAVITIGDAATWLIVEADGKEIFRGTMLAGTSQNFSAADSLKVSTGNAGKTDVALTNSVVVAKDLGPMGAVGEVKRDVQYNRDTK